MIEREIWLLSDTHWGHERIIGYCTRPFVDAIEMNIALETLHNKFVSPDDIYIDVGDMSAGLKQSKDAFGEYLGRLNGHKLLIRGNHDYQTDDWYKGHGFLDVRDHFYAKNVLFAHCHGIISDTYMNKLILETNALQLHYKPVLTIHGHDHRTEIPEYPAHFNCASDRHSFTPFTLRDALKQAGHPELTTDLYAHINLYVEELLNL